MLRGRPGHSPTEEALLQAREAELEKEQQRVRKEKEAEIARLRALQEKAQDYRAEQVPDWAGRCEELLDVLLGRAGP